jgi:RsiW-degrading membrane proteinase PrsW (M82 family)
MLTLLINLAFVAVTAFIAWYFLSRDRGSREPLGALWAAFGFGVLGLVLAIILEIYLVPYGVMDGQASLSVIIYGFMMVGIIEELVKFGPLALFIYRQPYFNEYTDGIIYFGISGMAFGLGENIMYTLIEGNTAGIARLLIVPFFHTALSGIAGYYLVRAKLNQRSILTVALPLLVIMFVHGLYDIGLSLGLTLGMLLSFGITIALVVALFWYYRHANKQDQALGLSAIGENSFCRHCGIANQLHRLYCGHCGQQA